MGLQFSQIPDAVLTTQNLLIKKGAFVDMQTDLSDHVAVREMWKKRRKKFAGGENWEFQVQMDHNHSARTVALFESDGSSINDAMVNGEVAARHINAHYIFDLREKDFQRGDTAIVDLVKTRYVGMIVSLYELLEELLWGKPEDSSDEKTPYGIKYWVTRSATSGFNGGDPDGFSDGRAGISTNDYPRFANYTGAYADVSKEDLVRTMRQAARKIKFRSPVSHSVPKLASTGNGIYTNDTIIGLIEEILEANNMNLGNDIAPKDGRAMFKGTPLTYAPYLDNDSTNPIYMLDWRFLQIGVMPGWENNVTKPYRLDGKHNVRRVDLDASLNMVCTDPRKQAVFYQTS
jgi:hypothetical protein